MPRAPRLVSLGQPHHLTQRGNNRQRVFYTDHDHHTYLDLLRHSTQDAGLRLLGYCCMPNHIHLIAIPLVETALAEGLGRAHGAYAQYFNRRHCHSGHLWQNRFYSCPLRESHLWTALRYVDQNPVRAGLVDHATDYRWSSARAHLGHTDEAGLVDQAWWRQQQKTPTTWATVLATDSPGEADDQLRAATRVGRVCGKQLPPKYAQRAD